MSAPEKPFTLREADERVRQGNAALKEGRLEDAYAAWKEAIEIDPLRAGVLSRNLQQLRARLVRENLAEARKASEAGSPEVALDRYRKVLHFEPEEPEVLAEARAWLDRFASRERIMRRSAVAAGAAAALVAAAGFSYLVYRFLQ